MPAVADQGQLDAITLENNDLFFCQLLAFPREGRLVIDHLGRVPAGSQLQEVHFRALIIPTFIETAAQGRFALGAGQ